MSTALRRAAVGLIVALWIGAMPLAHAEDISAPPDCSVSLQSLIDATPAGTVLLVPGCVYHETITIRKPLTLDGQGKAEIRGSDVWSSWSQTAAGWVSTSTVPPFTVDHQGRCADGSDRCNRPEQVFQDGTPLAEVGSGSAPGSGQFALDGTRRVIVHDDPGGHVMEVSTRERWVDTEADNVTIQGFTFWHAANAAETGGIGNQSRNGWTLQDSKLYSAHGGIVSLGGATNPNSQTRVLRNEISGSGYEAINGYQNTNTVIQGNTIYSNNLAGFDSINWAGAGVKVVSFSNLLIDDNAVYGNAGPGIWCDIGCQNVTISNNHIHDNQGAGILFEISTGARIFGNAIWNTAPRAPAINLSSSSNAEIHDNVVAWNHLGIAVNSEDRTNRPPVGTVGISVHDNTIVAAAGAATALQWFQRGAGNLFDPTAHNSGEANTFWYPDDEDGYGRFRWQAYFASLDDFKNTPGGMDGRYLSLDERDRLLAASGVPTLPTQ